jgi:tRNA threonylcarbamoyladenosine biosynthesis protein TsaB
VRILAVDTATATGSVALLDGEVVVGEALFETPSLHSAHVLPAVASVLRAARAEPREIEGYAVTIGPGPFTGLRVGISTVQGLAMGAGRPTIGVPSLDVLAAQMQGEGPTVVAMIDAGRGQVYVQTYDSEGRRLGEAGVLDPAGFHEWLPQRAAFVGDGALLYRKEIEAARPASRFPGRSATLARTLGVVAASLFAAGRGVPPEELRPLYLRGADIRRSGRAS